MKKFNLKKVKKLNFYKIGFWSVIIPSLVIIIYNGVFATGEKIAIIYNGGIHPDTVREMINCNYGDNMIINPICTGANVEPLS